jgi:hypothetical protein
LDSQKLLPFVGVKDQTLMHAGPVQLRRGGVINFGAKTKIRFRVFDIENRIKSKSNQNRVCAFKTILFTLYVLCRSRLANAAIVTTPSFSYVTML